MGPFKMPVLLSNAKQSFSTLHYDSWLKQAGSFITWFTFVCFRWKNGLKGEWCEILGISKACLVKKQDTLSSLGLLSSTEPEYLSFHSKFIKGQASPSEKWKWLGLIHHHHRTGLSKWKMEMLRTNPPSNKKKPYRLWFRHISHQAYAFLVDENNLRGINFQSL